MLLGGDDVGLSGFGSTSSSGYGYASSGPEGEAFGGGYDQAGGGLQVGHGGGDGHHYGGQQGHLHRADHHEAPPPDFAQTVFRNNYYNSNANHNNNNNNNNLNFNERPWVPSHAAAANVSPPGGNSFQSGLATHVGSNNNNYYNHVVSGNVDDPFRGITSEDVLRLALRELVESSGDVAIQGPNLVRRRGNASRR